MTIVTAPTLVPPWTRTRTSTTPRTRAPLVGETTAIDGMVLLEDRDRPVRVHAGAGVPRERPAASVPAGPGRDGGHAGCRRGPLSTHRSDPGTPAHPM